VQTDNVEAGKLACQFIIDKLSGKGNVIIENGPQVTSVTDRVTGCKSALAAAPDIKVLSDDQDAKGSREGGLNAMQGYLTRFPKIDGLFAINDPQAIGSDLAARQLKRSGIIITSVDGAPDIENALKTESSIQASASQDPWAMAQQAVVVGNDILNDKKPAEAVSLLTPKLITRDNISDYKGWESKR
jgi:ribose transport system substrate-binding protein